ncbi:MAG: BamA/TamA family outer membrane protein [Bacteroidaceae bacterium]|nr:BamA/TamA family outer membrane protein [Bacteroidaceae bacterium]
MEDVSDKKIIVAWLLAITVILAGCSTTSNLPEDEYLYIGIKDMNVVNRDSSDADVEALALEEVKSALSYAPNNSFMGSSSVRLPLPIGLWCYNGLVNNHGKGLRKWLFDSFASTPVTVTSVAPETRAKVAANTLQNYGYFRGSVDFDIIDRKNPRKKKISYTIDLGRPYMLDSVIYDLPTTLDSIRLACSGECLLADGSQFNVANLQLEKERLVSEFRDNGYYYYRTDYLTYLADSTINPFRVRLLMAQNPDIPAKAGRQWNNGKIRIRIRDNTDMQAVRGMAVSRDSLRGMGTPQYQDSILYRNATIYFSGDECPISPKILMRNFRFREGHLFSQRRIDETVENLSNMQIFSQMQFSYTPRDTTDTCNILDMNFNCMMDKLVDAEFGLDITQKSNSYFGPRATLTVSKRNAFGHGETVSLKGVGSYEWQTGNHGGKHVDSYEAGLDASITYPWLVFPGLSQKRFRFATSSTFKVGFRHLKRAGYYRQLSFSANADYSFRSDRYYSHRFSPLSLAYNKLEDTTDEFNEIVADKPSLYYSLRDQFIPSMSYSVVYDNNWKDFLNFTTRVELSVKESGNIVSGVYSLAGSDFKEVDKKLFNLPYAQFVRVSFDVRHLFRLSPSSVIATRFIAGSIWAYGNSTVAPNSEQFFVGGANDLRAFSAYALGPGRFYEPARNLAYFEHVGSLKLGLNAEYRFPLAGNLNGALFFDMGNVWSDYSEYTRFKWGELLDDIATGTGLGLRYNLDIIVLRLDMGVALHVPYDTGRSGYYNIRSFWSDGVGIHFAVGYPF